MIFYFPLKIKKLKINMNKLLAATTTVEETIAYDKTQHCVKYYGNTGWSSCLSDRKVHEGDYTVGNDAEFKNLKFTLYDTGHLILDGSLHEFWNNG